MICAVDSHLSESDALSIRVLSVQSETVKGYCFSVDDAYGQNLCCENNGISATLKDNALPCGRPTDRLQQENRQRTCVIAKF